MAAFTSSQRTSLRKYMGYGQGGNYGSSTLFESILSTFEGSSYASDQTEILSLVTQLDTVMTNISNLQLQMQVSSADKGDAVLDAVRGMKGLRAYGRQLVGQIATLLGVPPARDAFGTNLEDYV